MLQTIQPFDFTEQPADLGPFEQLDTQLSDKGFFLTSVEELVNLARAGSLMWNSSGLPVAPSR
jgi:hypothetical protein